VYPGCCAPSHSRERSRDSIRIAPLTPRTRLDSLAQSHECIHGCCVPDHSRERSRDSTRIAPLTPHTRLDSLAQLHERIHGCCAPDHSCERSRDLTRIAPLTPRTRLDSPARSRERIRGCCAPDITRTSAVKTRPVSPPDASHPTRLARSIMRAYPWLLCARSLARAQSRLDSPLA